MAKIYQFPTQRLEKGNKNSFYNDKQNVELLRNLMETLMITYQEKINELEGYKKEIAKENGSHLKSPRELIKKVKYLQQMFQEYGISCNFFRFYTKNEVEVIYYNETSLIYVVSQAGKNEGIPYSVGEFIQAYEGYPFTLYLDQELFNVFDKQVDQLHITIETLQNTEV